MPKRIQRKRTKNFRLADVCTNPNGYRCVTRGTLWGNPFVVGHRYAEGDSFFRHYGHLLDDGLVTPENCLTAFRAYCDAWLRNDDEWLEPLRGKDLACWCPLTDRDGNPVPCHADILLELAAGAALGAETGARAGHTG